MESLFLQSHISTIKKKKSSVRPRELAQQLMENHTSRGRHISMGMYKAKMFFARFYATRYFGLSHKVDRATWEIVRIQVVSSRLLQTVQVQKIRENCLK